MSEKRFVVREHTGTASAGRGNPPLLYVMDRAYGYEIVRSWGTGRSGRSLARPGAYERARREAEQLAAELNAKHHLRV